MFQRLLTAIKSNDTAAFNRLWVTPQDPNIINHVDEDYHCTLLHWACIFGNVDIAILLLKSNASLTARSSYKNRTPLHFACRNGSIEIVKLLLPLITPEMMAAKDDDNKTAFELAIKYNHPQCLIEAPKIQRNLLLMDKVAPRKEVASDAHAELCDQHFYSYETIFPLLKAARTAGAEMFIHASVDKEGRHGSGVVTFQAIDVDVQLPPCIRPIHKSGGYDENFRRESFYKERGMTNIVDMLDQEFGIRNNATTFTLAFFHSRFPTNAYIHFTSKSPHCTGHPGGFFTPPNITTNTTEALRNLSVDTIKTYKGTKGENKVGSVGGSPGFFHYDRDQVISKVIEEARQGDAAQKAASPEKATAEALKYVINHTIGYQEDHSENDTKFSGLTTDGLNISEPVSRRYASKHYQATRDAEKIAAVAYENRFNNVDSDADNESEAPAARATSTPDIDLLNRKVCRTKLEAKYHGRDSTLSPLRCDSPYSRANIDISIAMVESARSYPELCSVYNAPIPVIHPTNGLFAAEDARSRSVRVNRDRAKPNPTQQESLYTTGSLGQAAGRR